jgi:beta-mannosidase
VPKKEIHLPAAQIETELSSGGAGYVLRLASKVLARSVYVTFGTLDVQLSDNYFDLIPNQPVEITIQSKASLGQLKQAMKVISLVDAFAAPAAVAQN